MTETAQKATPPLKTFQKLYCRHCSEACNPNETRFLACTLAAVLDIQAYQTKLRTEHPHW